MPEAPKVDGTRTGPISLSVHDVPATQTALDPIPCGLVNTAVRFLLSSALTRLGRSDFLMLPESLPEQTMLLDPDNGSL